MSDFEGISAYIVNGYLFESKEEYELALQEKKGIGYLNSQTDLSDTDKVLSLYNELIDKRIFRTVVGIEYLKQLRAALLKSAAINKKDVLPVCIPSMNTDNEKKIEKYISRKYEDKVKELDKNITKQKNKKRTSIILNIVLAIMVIAMFAISSTTSNANILNYERVLQDKYATWAGQLSDKEKELRQWEDELDARDKENAVNSQN